MGQLLPGVQPLVTKPHTREEEVRDRFKIWWRLRSLKKHKDIVVTTRYWCTYEGCEDEISLLRFLLVGCICKPHAWIRRWGG